MKVDFAQKKQLAEEQHRTNMLTRDLGAAKAFSSQAKAILKDLTKASTDENFLRAFGKRLTVNATIVP